LNLFLQSFFTAINHFDSRSYNEFNLTMASKSSLLTITELGYLGKGLDPEDALKKSKAPSNYSKLRGPDISY
jgi:hypothetical protein